MWYVTASNICGTLAIFFFYEMDQLVRKTIIMGRDWKLRGQIKNAVRGREQKLQQQIFTYTLNNTCELGNILYHYCKKKK